jgi:hypothetical protein
VIDGYGTVSGIRIGGGGELKDVEETCSSATLSIMIRNFSIYTELPCCKNYDETNHNYEKKMKL